MLELETGKIYECSDGNIRKLTKIEDDYLTYSVPIGDKNRKGWMNLSKTYRYQVESKFVNGKIITNEEAFI